MYRVDNLSIGSYLPLSTDDELKAAGHFCRSLLLTQQVFRISRMCRFLRASIVLELPLLIVIHCQTITKIAEVLREYAVARLTEHPVQAGRTIIMMFISFLGIEVVRREVYLQITMMTIARRDS
ncbi:hypothetical protein GGR58DRAFT_495503 [Xylaria digitata]|nr:hypothetical protein GGR58DRAFT_495503 [Xylaria digitata]